MANENKTQPDDPRQANEEGDPKTSGRSRGHIVDKDNPQGPTRTVDDKPGDESTERSEHWESGRQRAN